jgi:endonuclease/exonuclease/phosphatase family metal-dependent hydrolase
MKSVRVVTFNLWNDRPDVVKRMRVAIDGLRALQPDLIGLQEVWGPSRTDNQAVDIARALELNYAFDPVEERAKGGIIGNAVISRYPIQRFESLSLPSTAEDPRRALHCAIETPAGVMPFFTTHFSWEMWHSPRRETQAVALDEFVAARHQASDLPPVLTGDLNAAPDSDVVRFLTGRASLHGRGAYYRDAWHRRHPHEDGYTWSDRNPYAVRWIERNRRLDYILVGRIREDDGWGAILDSRVVLDIPGPDGIFASDHFAVFAEIGISPTPETAV